MITEQHIKEALERLEAAHGCLMEVFAFLRNAESEEKEGDA